MKFDFIYNYSFALSPEDVQPSGSMNASRIDSITLEVVMNTAADTPTAPTRGNANIRIYAQNHNVLRVIDGYGGLLFRV